MKESAQYLKIVIWSEEDNCYVGVAPGLIGPCCHGDDEIEVYAELCDIVDEWIEIIHKDGKSLPPATVKDIFSDSVLNKEHIQPNEMLQRALASSCH